MSFQNVYLLTFRQKLKMSEVGMAIKADRIVVKDGFLQVFAVPYIYLIGMRIVAFPARKPLSLQQKMCTCLVVGIYFLKTEA
jgi:hypothetical protein